MKLENLWKLRKNNNLLPDPNDPVEAEKSGMPLSIVSAFGESPSVTPSTSTPRNPTGLSELTFEYLAPSEIKLKKCSILSRNSHPCYVVGWVK